MFRLVHVLGATAILAGLGCSNDARRVVVYVSLDELYSRPVLDAFEAETGIRVDAVYDTEAAKTTGLVNRIIAERDRPRADVFWNNEVAQTIRLKSEGLLAPYASPNAEAIPDGFRDSEDSWTGFAARARVIIYNTDRVTAPPDSIHDLLDPVWRGEVAIANPLFGTTATHAAALFAFWGEDAADAFFQGLEENDIAVLAGNATVRDLVARGEYAWGLTDTDDANGGVQDGYPVAWRLPDQGEGELGTLLIPNTVAVIANGPNPEAAKRLVDFLLRAETERALSEMRSIQIPLNPAVDAPENVPEIAEIRTMAIEFDAVAREMELTAKYIQSSFLP